MNNTLSAIWDMERALRIWKQGQPHVQSKSFDEIHKYIQSIEWKLRFLDHYCRLLSGVNWADLGRLGGPDMPPSLSINCDDSDDLIIKVASQETGRLLILSAFDGAVAASVNASDTLGRLLNLCYDLGLPDMKANLPIVSKRIQEGSPVGIVLNEEPGIRWMEPLRKLRGECQHRDISAVVMQAYGGLRQEPVVVRDWCPGSDAEIPVSKYTSSARLKTMELLSNAARAVSAGAAEAIHARD